MTRLYQLTAKSRLGAIALALVLLGVVGFFLAFGFVLVLGLGVAGVLLGVGAALRSKLTGRPGPNTGSVPARHGLDPAKEVSPGSGQSLPAGDRAKRETDSPA